MRLKCIVAPPFHLQGSINVLTFQQITSLFKFLKQARYILCTEQNFNLSVGTFSGVICDLLLVVIDMPWMHG